METQDRARVAQYGLALRGQEQPAAFMDKDRLAGEFLESLQLQGDRRLGAAEPPRGLCDASGLDNRHQRTQHPNIEVNEVHCVTHGPGPAFSMQVSCCDAEGSRPICADETGFGVQGPTRCSQKGRGATSNMRRELKGCDEAPSAGIGITITEAAALRVICASALPMPSRLRSRARLIPSSRRFPEVSS
jgi:hypothetical protein